MVSTPFVPVPPPRYGGTELVVKELVTGLIEAGHEVTLFATGDSSTEARLEACFETAVWPPEPYSELAHASWALARIISAAEEFDLIHAHIPAALALARFTDVPIVYTVHHELDEALLRFYSVHEGEFHPVAISRRQCELLLGRRDCAVVHHGLDVDLYPEGPGGEGLAFLGRLAPEKGPHVAVDIARECGRRLRIGGQPHWKDQRFYEAEMAARLSEPHVEHLGELSHEPKCALLGSSLCTLCPLQWEEPFGLVMIESMLCGTPVLAFARGAAPEIIDQGITGFLARDAADMVRLIAHDIPRLDRHACRERAQKRFSRQRMVRDYLDVYERAVLRQPSHPVHVDVAETRH